MVTFYGAALGRIHGILSPLFALLLVIWVSLMLEARRNSRSGALIAAGVVFVGFGVVLSRFIAHVDNGIAGVAVEKLLVLGPASAAVGWMLVRTRRIVVYYRAYLIVGVLTVFPAIGEYETGHAFLRHGHPYLRNGTNRAVVGADHPLVLATLFLSLIPMAFYLIRPWWRYVVAALLYVGVMTTGSNGPEIVGAVVLVLCVLRPVARATMRTMLPFSALLAGLAAYLTIGGIWWWATQIRAFNTTDASNQYRAGLYYILPRMLHAKPFGYGWDGFPHETWFFSTRGSGIVDVSQSLDSEVLFAAAQSGYVGVFLFLVVAVSAIKAATRNQAVGLSSLSVTLAGLFLAIHAWTTLGCYWFLGFGVCAAMVLGYDGSSDSTAITDPEAAPPSDRAITSTVLGRRPGRRPPPRSRARARFTPRPKPRPAPRTRPSPRRTGNTAHERNA